MLSSCLCSLKNARPRLAARHPPPSADPFSSRAAVGGGRRSERWCWRDSGAGARRDVGQDRGSAGRPTQLGCGAERGWEAVPQPPGSVHWHRGCCARAGVSPGVSSREEGPALGAGLESRGHAVHPLEWERQPQSRRERVDAMLMWAERRVSVSLQPREQAAAPAGARTGPQGDALAAGARQGIVG